MTICLNGWAGWALWGMLALLLAACGGKSATTPVDPQQLEVGKAVYTAHCAACHGSQGEGEANWKVPDVNGVYPAPPHNGTGHTWHHADALLLQVLREGSGVPNSKMPVYRDILSEGEMEAALAYIKTFWGADEVAFQRQLNEQWKEQNR
ncbi:MAG: cytochrome c [Caldilineaceae bacterium]|nr:cytochrome c [Caldilineaceae bacterium]HRJ44156.1 cytochrome c [Caldilineaceae bacterium]